MVKKEKTLHETIDTTDTPPIIRGRTDMTDVYIEEAGRCVKKARDAFNISLNADGNERKKALWEEKQNSLFTIMFSVFALEAHINRIGHDDPVKTEWEKRERNSLENKWYDFPKLLSGNTFDKKSKLYENFREIIKLRNYLVHFKDYEYKEFIEHRCGNRVVGIYEHVNVDNADLAYTTANDMIKKLDEILKKK